MHIFSNSIDDKKNILFRWNVDLQASLKILNEKLKYINPWILWIIFL